MYRRKKHVIVKKKAHLPYCAEFQYEASDKPVQVPGASQRREHAAVVGSVQATPPTGWSFLQTVFRNLCALMAGGDIQQQMMLENCSSQCLFCFCPATPVYHWRWEGEGQPWKHRLGTVWWRWMYLTQWDLLEGAENVSQNDLRQLSIVYGETQQLGKVVDGWGKVVFTTLVFKERQGGGWPGVQEANQPCHNPCREHVPLQTIPKPGRTKRQSGTAAQMSVAHNLLWWKNQLCG